MVRYCLIQRALGEVEAFIFRRMIQEERRVDECQKLGRLRRYQATYLRRQAQQYWARFEQESKSEQHISLGTVWAQKNASEDALIW